MLNYLELFDEEQEIFSDLLQLNEFLANRLQSHL